MAARIENEMGVHVQQVHGHYGEFTVLVDDQVVVSGGPLGFMGVLPPAREVLGKVRAKSGA